MFVFFTGLIYRVYIWENAQSISVDFWIRRQSASFYTENWIRLIRRQYLSRFHFEQDFP